MLATSVKLVQADTELSLKTDVMMTANRCSDSTFPLLIIIIFAIVFILAGCIMLLPVTKIFLLFYRHKT